MFSLGWTHKKCQSLISRHIDAFQDIPQIAERPLQLKIRGRKRNLPSFHALLSNLPIPTHYG